MMSESQALTGLKQHKLGKSGRNEIQITGSVTWPPLSSDVWSIKEPNCLFFPPNLRQLCGSIPQWKTAPSPVSQFQSGKKEKKRKKKWIGAWTSGVWWAGTWFSAQMNHFRDRLEVNGCRGVIDAAIAVKVSNMQKRIAVSRIDHERAEEDEEAFGFVVVVVVAVVVVVVGFVAPVWKFEPGSKR